jgi:nicotinamide-nucleotide amidase
MLRATIIAIGDELVDGRVQDENSRFLAGSISAYGVRIEEIVAIPDNLEIIRRTLESALRETDIVITSSGLGPTGVDLTRDAVAAVTGIDTVIDPIVLEKIRANFKERGVMSLPEWAPTLARIPRGALALINPRGLAPGFVVQTGGATLACLPGEPEQVKAMWSESLEPDLKRRFNLQSDILTRTLQVATGEPALVKLLDDWLSGKVEPKMKVTVRSNPGVMSVDLRAEASGIDEREQIMEFALRDIRKRLGDAIFGEGDDRVEDALIRVLVERGLTIAVAESSTGGAVSSRLVNVPGASRAFLEGMVCYSNESKIQRLGVPSEFIRMYGAVSESVAMAMAAGIRVVAGSDVGLAVTGLLGPSGGSPEKPVGTTWIACDILGAMSTSSMIISGGRRTVKRWASRSAINFARLSVLRSGGAF